MYDCDIFQVVIDYREKSHLDNNRATQVFGLYLDRFISVCNLLIFMRLLSV